MGGGDFCNLGQFFDECYEEVGKFRGLVRRGEWVGGICVTWGSSLMNVWALASLAACSISSSVTSSRP